MPPFAKTCVKAYFAVTTPIERRQFCVSEINHIMSGMINPVFTDAHVVFMRTSGLERKNFAVDPIML